MAVSILKHLQQQSSLPSAGARHPSPVGAGIGAARDGDVLLMQSVCQLLLGEVQGSLTLLRQAEAAAAASAANPAADDNRWAAGAYAFVEQSSSSSGVDDDGLLPGLCLLTEQWLKQVCKGG